MPESQDRGLPNR